MQVLHLDAVRPAGVAYCQPEAWGVGPVGPSVVRRIRATAMTTSILSRFPSLRHLAPRALAGLAGGERRLSCIAGFFGDEARAQVVQRRLRQDVGLAPGRVLLLRPRDAQPDAFERAARAWRAARPVERTLRPEHRGWGAAAGGALGGLIYWAVTLLDPQAKAAEVMAALPMGAAWGALVGLLVVLLLERLPEPRRFDGEVRRALQAGRFAVVVAQVPTPCEAEVLALVRGHSRGWCAEAPRARR